MKTFLKWISGVSLVMFVINVLRQWGIASERQRQAEEQEKKRRENQKLYKEIAQKHESFRQDKDVDSARQSFLNS